MPCAGGMQACYKKSFRIARPSQECNHFFGSRRQVAQFALPNRQRRPALFLKQDNVASVAGVVSLQLRQPVIPIGGRDADARAVVVRTQCANPDQPVFGIIGDGSAMMTIQGLWTAANDNIPCVFVICNNGMYRVLKVNFNVNQRDVLEPPETSGGLLLYSV